MCRWLLPLLFLQTGCASLATGALANALSGSGGVYGQDEDPQLVAAAVPFALKTMEGVLVEQPEHVGLLTALTAGFVQYGYAFVLPEAEQIAESDFERSLLIKKRARRFFLRAQGYGWRGMEAAHEGFQAALSADPQVALAMLEPEDVPLLYWTTAAGALQIGISNLDPKALAELPTVQAMLARALELDEGYNDGVLHELAFTLELAVPGGSKEKALVHYQRALELSGGRRASTFVGYAEAYCVKAQDRKAFDQALEQALAIDVDQHPNDRLANVIAQDKARRLQAAADDLILDLGPAEDGPTPEGS
jgi:predicted anti-sigma-YlaC factor YlaD